MKSVQESTAYSQQWVNKEPTTNDAKLWKKREQLNAGTWRRKEEKKKTDTSIIRKQQQQDYWELTSYLPS
jgi:hypothetical protein